MGYLPDMDASELPLRREAGAHGEPPARVLVVDDDAPTRLLLSRVLRNRGYQVLEAEDGAACRRILAEEDVDVVLLDANLPDISGIEVLAQLRAAPRTATLPVVVVTGRAHPADRVAGLEAGANDYLTKPVDLNELVATVRAQVRGRDAWRSQVADVLRARAAITMAVASIDEGLSPEEAAEQVVTLLLGLDEVHGAAVVETGPDGSARVLAGTHLPRHGLEVGHELPRSMVADMLRTTAAGADPLLRRTGVLPIERVAPVFPEMAGDVVLAALGPESDPWAILVLETASRPPRRFELLRRVGAGAADLVPVVERVLGPAVRNRSARSVAEALTAIIEQRAFHPVFQPIVDLETGAVVGFEALTRFDDQTRPDRRFAQASLVGLGMELERVTLEAALSASVCLPAGAFLSTNVSATFLIGGHYDALMSRAGERPVVLEVTEHEQIDDYEAVRAVIAGLGPDVRLSVDDAGSGWASLRHVLSLRPDYVKLDRGWITEIEDDPARQALLLGIRQFVGLMEGTVIAEGIETAAELDTLRRLGLPLGQGYLLGRPAPVAAHDHPPAARTDPDSGDRGPGGDG